MCLALSRTCAERRLIGRECDSNTLKVIDDISSIDVRNKQLLLKGVLEPTVEELCPSPEQSAQNWRLSQLATHALAAVSAHTTGPVSLIRLLCHHPEQLEDCILPAMASDPRMAVANARFDFTTWYQVSLLIRNYDAVTSRAWALRESNWRSSINPFVH